MNESCVFCDRKNFEERIVWENDNFFIIATLGQITDGGYVLLTPKKHVLFCGAMDNKEIEEAEILSNKIVSLLIEEYDVPGVSIFEHGIVGQTVKHAHLHFIPGYYDVTESIYKDFPEQVGFYFSSLSDLAYTFQRGGSFVEGKPYLLWKDSAETKKLLIDPKPQVPAQYLRIVFADAIGRLDRANWKNVDQKEDAKLIFETVERMKKYF